MAVDALTGRTVSRVEETDDGWVLQFEDGSEIHNYDPRVDLPVSKDIKGQVLLTTVMGSNVTRLFFGYPNADPNIPPSYGYVVELSPMEYAVKSDMMGEEPIFPQRGVVMGAEETRPPDPSPLRTHDEGLEEEDA
jgi:hypothetical protein